MKVIRQVKIGYETFETGQLVTLKRESHSPFMIERIDMITDHEDGSYTINLSDGAKLTFRDTDSPTFFSWPSAGKTIHSAAETALNAVRHYGLPVHFDFNEIRIHVTSEMARNGTKPSDIIQQYMDEQERRADQYRMSQAGQRAEQQAKAEAEKNQRTHDDLMEELPAVVEVESFLLNWLSEFSEVADNMRVRKNLARVIELIEAQGYTANANLGLDPAKYQDKKIFADYIVGQALDNMRSGMPPHPVIQRFVREYQAL